MSHRPDRSNLVALLLMLETLSRLRVLPVPSPSQQVFIRQIILFMLILLFQSTFLYEQGDSVCEGAVIGNGE